MNAEKMLFEGMLLMFSCGFVGGFCGMAFYKFLVRKDREFERMSKGKQVLDIHLEEFEPYAYGKCPNCEASCYEEMNYCEKCGQKLKW
jgi:hypothetical protein